MATVPRRGDASQEEHAVIEIERRLPPLLKWAGGKRWLTHYGVPSPTAFERLVEPFVGSGAVFFSQQPERAFLADLNEELINLYHVIRDFPVKFEEYLREHQREHSPLYYYEIRGSEFSDSIQRAARMLYLNRTCWNGLYRVNKSGKFNVPIGTKSSVIMDREDFSEYSNLLHRADLVCQDFEETIDACGDGDFLFVDPPYTVKHNMNGFVKYNEKIFSWDDQVRLVAALRRAGGRGAHVVVTNADHESLVHLYQNGFQYSSVARQSVLAGSSMHRGQTTEAIFTLNIN